MADIGNLHVRVGLDSSGFQQGVSQINQEMQRVQSQFKAASAEVGKHGSELEKLKTKSSSLTQQKELQRQKVAALESAHKQSAEVKGVDAKATVDLEVKLNKAKAALSGMEHELTAINQKIATQSSSWYQLGERLEPIGKSMEQLGSKMQDVGKSLTTKLTLPILGLGAAAIKIGSDFEAGMSEVQAISGATGQELEALNEKAKEMGASTKFSASQSAEALKYMAMAGWDTSSMLDGLSGVMTLAAASGESLAMVSDIVTDAMTAFGMQAHQAGDFADLLANTASSANTNVAMMGETFKYAAPLFGALGYSAEDAALAIGLMGNAGVKGSQAGTTLRSALTNLANPTSSMSGAMEELGISMTDASGQMLPFKDIMDNLRVSFADLNEEQQAQYAANIFGKQAMSGMLAVITASEADYQKLTDATRNYSGAASEMAEIMQDNLQGQLTILRSQLEGVAIQIYEILVPTLRSMVESLQKAVEWFSNLNPNVQEAIVKFGVLLAAIGPVLVITGKLVSTIGGAITTFSNLSKAIAAKSVALNGMTVAAKGAVVAGKALVVVKTGLATAFAILTGPIGLVVAAIAGLVAAGVLLYKNWDTVKEVASSVSDGIANGWDRLKESTASTWTHLTSSVSSSWEAVTTATTTAVSTMQDRVQTGWNNIREAATSRWDPITQGVSQVWYRIRDNTAIALGSVRDTVSTAWQAMGEKTTHSMQHLVEGVTSGWESLKAQTTTQWNEIANRVGVALGGLKNNTQTAIQGLGDIVRSGWTSVQQATVNQWEGMTNSVSTGWETLQEQASSGFNHIQETAKAGWEGVASLTTTALGTVREKAGNGWSYLKELTVGTWESIHGSVTGVMDKLASTFTGFVDGMKDTFERSVDFVLNPFRKISDGLSHLKNSVKDALSYLNPFAKHSPSLVDNVQAGCSIIDDAYSRLADRVRSAVGGMYQEIGEGPEDDAIMTTAALGVVADATAESLLDMTMAASLASKAWTTLQTALNAATKPISEFVNSVFDASRKMDGVIASFDSLTLAIHKGIQAIMDWNATKPDDKQVRITEILENAFHGSSIPKNFRGTSFFSGGLTMVGELGPELVQLPKGSRIYTNHETKTIQQQSDARPSLTVHIERFIHNTDKDIEELAYQLEFYRQRMAIGRGRS